MTRKLPPAEPRTHCAQLADGQVQLIPRPGPSEASPYYFTYIDQVEGADLITVLEDQLHALRPLAGSISDEGSLHRYEPGKWTVRELLNHVTDAERLFAFRAFWFARGFESALPSLDQNVAVTHAQGLRISWRWHIEGVPIRPPFDYHSVREHACRRMVAPRHRQRQPVHGSCPRIHRRRPLRPSHANPQERYL